MSPSRDGARGAPQLWRLDGVRHLLDCDHLLHCQAAAGSLRRSAKLRLGALLSSDRFGSIEAREDGVVAWCLRCLRFGHWRQ
jgi:hypothetical protein